MTITTDPLHRVLGLLGSVHKVGAEYSAKCPAHDDRKAGLSVSSGDDGRLERDRTPQLLTTPSEE
jgi:hypothetical protein